MLLEAHIQVIKRLPSSSKKKGKNGGEDAFLSSFCLFGEHELPPPPRYLCEAVYHSMLLCIQLVELCG